ncbi:MAG: long-chain-fatty-acid--CoA ligase [Pseudomonadales bacterium]|nr:long-chain-fatty-acid--CoA ligase [Pseudomonadales bacterium]
MFSITQLVRRIIQTEGAAIATVDGNRSHTWEEFGNRVARLAGGLQDLGLREDGCAAILALNSDRYFEFMFGVPWAGGVFQPVNTRLAGPEVVYWLNDSEASILFVDTAFQPLVESIRGELEHVKHFVFVDDGEVPDGYIAYESLLDKDPVADAGRSGDDVAGLFYTGGTTGRSKGVMLTHNNIVINSLQSVGIIDCTPNDQILHVAPMFHIADAFVCMTSATLGGTNYFLPGFEPVATMKAIQEYKIDRLLMVPTMINMLVNHPDAGMYDLTSLRVVTYGASPMPEAVICKAMEVIPGAGFYQAYGQTEASPCITILPPSRHVFDGEFAGKIKSAGQALPGIELAILDENNLPVAPGTVGEVCMKGPNMMKGYRNMAEQTANTIVDGWLHTGDGGYLDEDGFLFIVDRVKDMIISGGENVYSAEVENVVHQHAAVNQCAVIGIPSEKWGEQVHAIVVLHEGASATEEEIINHCRSQIAGFKCPRSVSFRTEPLPLSGAGKILKTELRKPYWEGAERSVN